MSQMSPFASRNLGIHLMRGAGAACLTLLAVGLIALPNLASAIAAVAALGGVVILLRGCPMCWLVGLIETVVNTRRKAAMTEPVSLAAYQEPSDLALAPNLAAASPTEAKAFLAFNAAAERTDGAIPPKYRKLIAVGVALTTPCASEGRD